MRLRSGCARSLFLGHHPFDDGAYKTAPNVPLHVFRVPEEIQTDPTSALTPRILQPVLRVVPQTALALPHRRRQGTTVMTLKDFLKKKDKIHEDQHSGSSNMLSPDTPEFTFMRTTTTTQSIIEPPSYPGDLPREQPHQHSPESHTLFGRLRRHSNAGQKTPDTEKTELHGLTERLHLGRQRSTSSVNVPEDLPDVGNAVVASNEDDEAKWEKRATMMAVGNTIARSGNSTPNVELQANPLEGGRKRSVSIGKPADDVCAWVSRFWLRC